MILYCQALSSRHFQHRFHRFNLHRPTFTLSRSRPSARDGWIVLATSFELHFTQETRAQYAFDDMTRGYLLDSARRVIGWHSTQETRVHYAFDDVARGFPAVPTLITPEVPMAEFRRSRCIATLGRPAHAHRVLSWRHHLLLLLLRLLLLLPPRRRPARVRRWSEPRLSALSVCFTSSLTRRQHSPPYSGSSYLSQLTFFSTTFFRSILEPRCEEFRRRGEATRSADSRGRARPSPPWL